MSMKTWTVTDNKQFYEMNKKKMCHSTTLEKREKESYRVSYSNIKV